MRNFYIIFFLAIYPTTLFANSGIELYGRVIANDYRYAEYDKDENRLNEESGVIYGQGLSFDFPFQIFKRPFFITTHYSYFDDSTPYRGQTQFGIPLKTETEHEIEQYSLSINMHGYRNIQFYSALSVNQRKRDIQPTSFTTGLYEVYDWFELSLGVQLLFGNHKQWEINGDVFQVLKPKIYIDTLSSNLGTHHLRLGEEPGFSLSLAYVKKFDNWKFENCASIKYQAFGISNTSTIENEMGRFSIFEPASETLSRTFTSSIAYLW